MKWSMNIQDKKSNGNYDSVTCYIDNKKAYFLSISKTPIHFSIRRFNYDCYTLQDKLNETTKRFNCLDDLIKTFGSPQPELILFFTKLCKLYAI